MIANSKQDPKKSIISKSKNKSKNIVNKIEPCSIAIQSDLETKTKHNATYDHKEEDFEVHTVNQQGVKRCCYHCFRLFIFDQVRITLCIFGLFT